MKTMTPFTTFFGRFAQRTRLQPGIAVALAGLFLLALLPREVSAQAQTFNYTGALQTYTVPAGAAGVIIQANGAGGGSGGNDANGWGGAGGDGARATGTYLAAPGTVLNIYVGQGGQSGKTSDGNPYTRATSVGAGGLAGGTTGYAGGVGGTPGGSGWSGGGAGGGAASVVATSGNTRVLIAGGGGGGQGGALDVMGRAGLDASATGAMPGAAGQAGTGRANSEDGAGGGGGGAGCPRGTGGGAVADSSGTNTSTQATGGGSCNTAAVTGFSVTGGGGGAGGPSVTGVAPASGSPGSNGSVIITPIIPVLSLTKSQPSPALQAAVNSVYTLTVTNSGTGPASAARVLDQLPTNMTYVSGTGTGWTCSSAANGSGTLVTCNFVGTIAAGSGSSTITITAKPTNTTTAITNYAAVGSNGTTTTVPTPTTCTAADTPTAGCAAPVTNSVVLGLLKSEPSPALQVGNNSAYTLTVTNSGTATATTARVVDQLPANMTYVSGTGSGWSCSAAGGLVTCNFVGTLSAGGGTSTITITATPTSTASVINRAAVDPTGGTTPPTASTCTEANTPSAGCAAPVTNIPTSVILGLVKSVPSPALQVGNNSAYTLTVTNSGTAGATTARVVDQLPANMSYVSGTGTGWTCTPSGSTLVTCDYSGSIAAGGGTAAITITATPTSTASVVNRAAVDPTGGTTPPTASTCTAANTPSAGCAAPVTNLPISVILGLVKSTPSPALQVGSNSAYTLTVTNTGTATTTTARVVDQLPANLTYVSGAGTNWSCSVAAGLVTCNYSGPAIAASGGTAAVVITVTPTSTAQVINRAAVDPTGGTTPPTASTCTAANTPSAGCAAPITSTPTSVILGLVKSTPSPALQVGNNSAYTLTVTNTGTAASTTARIVDQLPASLSYVSGAGAGWSCTTAANGGGTLVTCDYTGSIAASGGTAALVITVTPTSTASVTNYASVDPAGGIAPPTPTCTAANAPTPGCAAPVTSTPTSVILGLVKSDPSPALQVFSNSAYTLTVTNTGTATTTTARVVDQLPANLSYVSGVGTGWTCATAANAGGTLVTCNYSGSIAGGGGNAALVITVTSTSSVAVTNYASVDPSGGTTPPVPTTCTAANVPSAGCAAPVSTTAGRLVAGNVYSDANHNSNLDAGEAGIGGASALFVKLVPLSGGVCTGPATAAAPVSLSSGAYSLSSVAQGSYCLNVDGNSTLSDVTPAYPAGWIGTQNPTGVIQLVVGAAPPAPQNFGLYNGSKLSGNVFADNGAGGGTANNGIKAGSEAGLAGVTIIATQGGPAVASASSSSDGSYLLWVPAAISGTVLITPALPSGYIATGGSAGSTGGSYTRPSVSYTAAAGQSQTGVNFGMVAPNTLGPNGAQTAQPGTTVFYAHSYSAGTGGQVSFTLANAATPASPGWNQVLYQDSNCNAVLEASELPLSAAITVTAGQTVCLIVKQFVPAGAGQGTQNSVMLSAAFTYTNASPALAVNTLSATDLTTVGQAGDLSLAKLVSNITPVVPAPVSVPAPATSVNAKPGDTLEYSLTATNNGTQALSTLFVNDSTPAFTGFVSAACVGPLPAGITACAVTTQPAVGAQGALKWTFTGSLAPSAQLIVTYRVKVDQ